MSMFPGQSEADLKKYIEIKDLVRSGQRVSEEDYAFYKSTKFKFRLLCMRKGRLSIHRSVRDRPLGGCFCGSQR